MRISGPVAHTACLFAAYATGLSAAALASITVAHSIADDVISSRANAAVARPPSRVEMRLMAERFSKPEGSSAAALAVRAMSAPDIPVSVLAAQLDEAEHGPYRIELIAEPAAQAVTAELHDHLPNQLVVSDGPKATPTILAGAVVNFAAAPEVRMAEAEEIDAITVGVNIPYPAMKASVRITQRRRVVEVQETPGKIILRSLGASI